MYSEAVREYSSARKRAKSIGRKKRLPFDVPQKKVRTSLGPLSLNGRASKIVSPCSSPNIPRLDRRDL